MSATLHSFCFTPGKGLKLDSSSSSLYIFKQRFRAARGKDLDDNDADADINGILPHPDRWRSAGVAACQSLFNNTATNILFALDTLWF